MLEVVIVIKHMEDCAIHEDGPCTCGTEEELEAIALEEKAEWLLEESFD
jgi:hypothetical protein